MSTFVNSFNVTNLQKFRHKFSHEIKPLKSKVSKKGEPYEKSQSKTTYFAFFTLTAI